MDASASGEPRAQVLSVLHADSRGLVPGHRAAYSRSATLHVPNLPSGSLVLSSLCLYPGG